MGAVRHPVSQLYPQILAKINQRPGISPGSLKSSIPLSHCKQTQRLNAVLDLLFADGEIRLLCDIFSDRHAPTVRIYPLAIEPPDKELFKPARSGCGQIKTWIDPTVRTDYQPVRPSIADIPTITPFKAKQEPVPMPDANTDKERIEAALNRLVEGGRRFFVQDVQQQSGLDKNRFYSARDEELDQKIKQAIQEIKAKTSDPVELKAELDDLRDRNKELRQQLAEAQSRQQLIELAPLEYCQKQAQVWRQAIAKYQAEMARIQADITAASLNLAAYERLIAIHDAECFPATDSSNGKHAVAAIS